MHRGGGPRGAGPRGGGPRPVHRAPVRMSHHGHRTSIRVGHRGHYRHHSRGLFSVIITSIFLSSMIRRASSCSPQEVSEMRGKVSRTGSIITIISIIMLLAGLIVLFTTGSAVAAIVLFVSILMLGFGISYASSASYIGSNQTLNQNDNYQNTNNFQNNQNSSVNCQYCGISTKPQDGRCTSCGAVL